MRKKSLNKKKILRNLKKRVLRPTLFSLGLLTILIFLSKLPSFFAGAGSEILLPTGVNPINEWENVVIDTILEEDPAFASTTTSNSTLAIDLGDPINCEFEINAIIVNAEAYSTQSDQKISLGILNDTTGEEEEPTHDEDSFRPLTLRLESKISGERWTCEDLTSLVMIIKTNNPESTEGEWKIDKAWVEVEYTSQAPIINQRSYRWQYSTDKISEEIKADSQLKGINVGEKLALRVQIENVGKISTQEETYKLQFAEKVGPDCAKGQTWQDISDSTQISYSKVSSEKIPSAQTDTSRSCGDGKCTASVESTWASEETPIMLANLVNTELGFTLDTINAESEKNYCLRVAVADMKTGELKALSGKYISYPELTLSKNLDKEFRKELRANKLPEIKTDETTFQATDSPSFKLDYFEITDVTNPYIDGVIEESRVFEEGDFRITAEVIDNSGKGTEITPKITLAPDGHTFVELPTQNTFKPGKYTLNINVEEKDYASFPLTQDFTWGVLAINTNKSIYTPNEIVKFLMTVLDDNGRTVCDADVRLEVTSPSGKKQNFSNADGTIINSKECGPNNVTYVPDFYTEFEASEIGDFNMKMTAVTPNGERILIDKFKVEESVDFDIERIGPVRIYPLSVYDMKIKVKPNADFKGEVKDLVPESFEISTESGQLIANSEQRISWHVDWKAGETYELSYTFDAPDISPEFYLLGPLEIGDFKEARQWKIASDATPPYKMATGRYVGSGNYKSISGLGFAPEAVIIKASTNGGVGAFLKTTSMIDNASAYLGSATADDTAGLITLDPDGFTVTGTNANIANTTWTWAAFAGSDCTATGNFCVGRYTGNGTSPRLITTGFQPDIAIVKNTAATTAANFQTVGMTANYGQYFMATAQDTTGALFTSFSATGFNVGATNNTSAAIYNYISFKNVTGSINVGSFTGNGTSQSITSAGFAPEFVITKNTTAATPVGAVYNLQESYGDSSSYFTDTANVVGAITALTSNGFNVGANSTANGSGNTIFWMAFDGTTAVNSSGTFKMASGTYTGNGAYQNINGLGFAPDLVIIKGGTTQAGVFRTTQHNGDVTSYLDAATADFALGIQSLNPDGFNIGTSATVNSNGVAYYWTAYGNAWRPATNSGASDFVIGTYYGNGIDSRNITGLPFQPDMVAIKGSGAQAGTFRTSQHSGDSSSFFAATADVANNIQAFNTDGFQVGTAANVNTAATFYRYFAFKNGSNFTVNTYSGTGSTQNITTVGFQPDNIWVKQTGATRGVQRTSDMATNSALPFINVANVTNAVTGLLSNGFTVGTAAETNTSGTNNYRYVAWKENTTVAPPPYKMATGRYVGSGNYKSVSGLGFAPEAVIIKASTTGGAGAMLKTTTMIDNATAYLGAATADDTAGLITLDTDGFTVTGTNANIANTTWTWAAFAGSDCTATGNFCVGRYTGNGTSPRLIDTGFQPDLAMIKQTTAVAPNWRSLSMPNNYGQYFTATTQETTGALYTSLSATGFNVGATNNTSAGIYNYLAFKNVSGSINVGSYTGNGTSQSISGAGFATDFVFVKNANAATAVGAVYNLKEAYGNSSSYFTDTANVVGAITSLDSDGFSVGSSSTANGSGNTIYWAAFAGPVAVNSSGTFKMASGTYTGNGAYQNINGLGFAPDLVIIKGGTTQAGVFRTTQHNGDVTSYLDAATADFALGIQSLNPDGFNIGTSATVNSNGVAYYWTAYGNAWRPATNSGASDFVIGTYYGNGIDSRNITGLPFQPDMVAGKAATAVAGTFRTSQHSGDSSSFFAATADAANNIQAFNTDGFQVGTAANVNTAATFYRYFAFKSGPNFTVNTYSGTGSTQDITTVGFQPDNIWVKRTTNVRGVQRTSSMPVDSALPFINVANLTGAITGIISNGFTVGTATETNASGGSYRYVAWRIPVAGITISGSIYQSNESSLDTTVYNIYISVDNGSPISATVPGNGTYTRSGVSASSGNSIAVYIYNDANDTNTYTVTDGSTNITGLNLFVGKVAVGNNNSSTTYNSDICNQSTYPGASSPDDRLSSCSTNNITVESGVEWHILQSKAYDTNTSATLTTGSDGNLHVDENGLATLSSTGTISGNVTIDTGGTLATASSNTLFVSGNWTNSATFTPNSGTVTFTATSGTRTIDSTGASAAAFNNLTFGNGSGNAHWDLNSNLDVNGDLAVNYGTLHAQNSNNVNLGGSLSIGASGDYLAGSGIFTFDGNAGTATWANAATVDDLGLVAIGDGSVAKVVNLGSSAKATKIEVKANATLGLGSSGYTLEITGSGTDLSRPLYVLGTLNAGSNSIVKFTGTSASTVNALTYNNVEIVPGSGSPTYTLGLSGSDSNGTAYKIDDDSNFGYMEGSGRQLVRTSGGTLYAILNDGTYVEVWSSSDGTLWTQQDSTNAPTGDKPDGLAAGIDGSGIIHITYASGGNLRYVTFNTSGNLYGTPETVYSTANITGMDIVIDSNSKPHIVFYSNTTIPTKYYLYYTNKIGSSWKTPVQVDQENNNAYYSVFITVNNLDVPAITYMNGRDSDLDAELGNDNDADSFTSVVVDSSVAISNQALSIGFGSSGNAWISYVDATTNYITLAKHDVASAWTSGWTTYTNNNVGYEPSLTLKGTKSYIFYQDDNDDIVYDTYDDGWGGEAALAVGTYQDVKTKWSYNFNNQGNLRLGYLYSDGTDIYWNNLIYGSETAGTLVTNNFTVGNGSNAVTVTANANDPALDVNGNFTIAASAIFTASDSNTFDIGGSWSNSGTFNHSSATVIFDAGAPSKTIDSGGTDSGKVFYNVQFNNGSGGWTLQNNNIKVAGNLTITNVNDWTLSSSLTLEVNGVYSIANAETSATTWNTGSILYLNSGTPYTIGSKNQNAESYDKLQIGTNTDIRMWQSNAVNVTTPYTVDPTGSLVSQDHANLDGNLYIWGDYHTPTNAYWSYTTDFDGTDISGTPRDCVVRLASGATVTVDAGDTLQAIGAASHLTSVDWQSSGGYNIINYTGSPGGTINFQYASFHHLTGANGIDIQSGSAVTSLNNTSFDNIVSTGVSDAYVKVLASIIDVGNKTIDGVTFANTGGGAEYSVYRSGTSSGSGYTWNFTNPSGTLANEDSDYEPDGTPTDPPGMITWPSANNPPNSPSDLAQKKTDNTVIALADWTDETSVKFTVTASDPDNPDTLYLCIEADQLGTAFSNTEDSCGSGVAYSGTPVEVTHTLTGLTQGQEYHWQARVRDAASAYSSWVSFGSNTESDRDFGIDNTAASTGTVYDGNTIGSDIDENDGTLNEVEANWTDIVDAQSGVKQYQYAIGTTSGGTDIFNWTTKAETGNIFSDSFESGDLSAWDANSNDSGDLYASYNSSSDYIGLYGLAALIDDGNSIYVQDNFTAASNYYARFYINPNNLTMASSDTFTVVDIRSSTTIRASVELNYDGSNYRVRGVLETGPQTTPWVNINATSFTSVEIRWFANASGYVSLWVNGTQYDTATGNTNGLTVDNIQMGMVSDRDSGTSGIFYIDQFTSDNADYNGPFTYLDETISTAGHLHTGQSYFVSVRATNNAESTGGTTNSDGFQVLPTLTFGIAPSSVDFAELDIGNSWTDTKTTTTTASTNAYLGYVATIWVSANLTHTQNPSYTISNYPAPNSAPTSWSGTGFGYTTNDSNLSGSGGADRFTSGGPKYAGFLTSGVGDPCADHTAQIHGQNGPLSNDQFTITYRVTVSATQAAGPYMTNIIYIATPIF